jgi:hypothetical protein
MRKAYYSLMRIPAIALPFLIILFVLGATPAAAGQASVKAASLEAHEGMTISVQPWTDAAQYKEKFSKKSPLDAGVLAVQVMFRNDTEETLRVTLSRIRLMVHLDADNMQELQPLTAEELADAVLRPTAKDPTATRKKLPIPVGSSSKSGRDKKWTDLQKQALDAGVPSAVIVPHSTVQGLLYFDLQGQFDLLETAHLYVPEIAQMDGSKALTYFDIDLGRRASH